MPKPSIEGLFSKSGFLYVGKHQIYRDGDDFVLEAYDYTDDDGEDYFQVHGRYATALEAVNAASGIEEGTR